jgi:hypothetical protein
MFEYNLVIIFCMNEINSFDPFEKEHAILATLPVFQTKYTNFFRSSLEGRNVEYLQTSPLCHFKEILSDLGAHFHGFGKELVKGANLAFRKIFAAEKTIHELTFKINHVFRSTLQQKIDELSSMDCRVLNLLLDRAESCGKNVHIEEDVPYPIGMSNIGIATKISIDGLGTIFICVSSEIPSVYNRVVVQMDADKNIGDFHALLAFLNLQKSFQASSFDDIERLKIGHLFRTFFPRIAFPLERSQTFFDLSIDELKMKIIEEAPVMEEIFDTYLDKMISEEILPGRMRYRIPGLAQQAYDLGARGLTSAILGAWGDELYNRVESILKKGMLSSETRQFLNCSATGLSTISDYYSGGSDVVYTQMITEDNCRKNADFTELNYSSNIRLIFSLEAIETGTYQYFDDAYGNRIAGPNYYGTSYNERPGILEFIDALQNSTLLSSVRRRQSDREPIDLDKGWEEIEAEILRTLSEEKHHLEKDPLISVDENGRIRIMGMLLEEFLVVVKFWYMNSSNPKIYYGGHEVMIKERIDPKYIQKILVSDEMTREQLVSHLRKCDLIQNEQILGYPIDQFILVQNNATVDLFSD